MVTPKFKNEHAFNEWYTTRLRRTGGTVLCVVGSQMQNPGWPDRYVLHPRWCGWIEGKLNERQLEPAQRQVCSTLFAHGVPVFVLRYVEGAGMRLENMSGMMMRIPEMTVDSLLHCLELFTTTTYSR